MPTHLEFRRQIRTELRHFAIEKWRAAFDTERHAGPIDDHAFALRKLGHDISVQHLVHQVFDQSVSKHRRDIVRRIRFLDKGLDGRWVESSLGIFIESEEVDTRSIRSIFLVARTDAAAPWEAASSDASSGYPCSDRTLQLSHRRRHPARP